MRSSGRLFAGLASDMVEIGRRVYGFSDGRGRATENLFEEPLALQLDAQMEALKPGQQLTGLAERRGRERESIQGVRIEPEGLLQGAQCPEVYADGPALLGAAALVARRSRKRGK